MDSATIVREVRRHQAALDGHRAQAKEHQAERDRLIHELRESDPKWTYEAIAAEAGLTYGRVAQILRTVIAT